MNTLINRMAGDMKKGAQAMGEVRAEMAQMARSGKLAGGHDGGRAEDHPGRDARQKTDWTERIRFI